MWQTAFLARQTVIRERETAESACPRERIQRLEAQVAEAVNAQAKVEKLLREFESQLAKSEEAHKTTSEALGALKEDNTSLYAALERANEHLTEFENVAEAAWKLASEFRSFLGQLGMQVWEPAFEPGDALKTLPWIQAGLNRARTAVDSFGTHCAQVGWVGALAAADRVQWLDVDKV